MRLLFVCLLCVGTLSAASAQKVGYTNVELLMNYMPEVQSTEKQLRTYEEELRKKLKVKADYYQMKLTEYYEKAQKGEQDAALEQELIGLQEQIQKETAEAEAVLLNRRQELIQPIMDKIQNAVNEVAREGGFTYILNQTTGNNILFGLETMDITPQLAKKLGIQIPE